MRVLLTCIGSAGDVFPSLAIGAELRRRGHDVSLLTSAHFRSTAEKAGLEFTALSSEEEYQRAVEDPRLFEAKEAWQALIKLAVLPALRPVCEFIRERWVPGETVVVSSRFALGARIAQERWGIPTASVSISPSSLRSVFRSPRISGLWMPKGLPRFMKRILYRALDRKLDALMTPELNRYRAELGLPHVRRIFDEWGFSPDRLIGLFPAWFAAPQPDWPRQLRLTGFPLFDGGEEMLPPSVERFLAGGEPPIVFTPGTAMSHGEAFFHESVLACEAAGVRGLLVSPYVDQIPKDLPSFVRHVPRASFSALFPRTAAVVHSGGIGTTAQAMAAGAPQLVVPLAHDQFDNADRLQKLGVGLTIHRPNYQMRTVARGLKTLLSGEEIKKRCKEVAARFIGAKPIEESCEMIEALGGRGPAKD